MGQRGGASQSVTGRSLTRIPDDLRQATAAVLLDRADSIVADAVAVFPFIGVEHVDAAYCHQVGHELIRLLTFAVRDDRLDAHDDLVAVLLRLLQDRSVPMVRLFAFAYLIERAALDDIALGDAIGATTEPWPLVAQLVRRASFELLAAIAEHARQNPASAATVDALTTLYRRPILDAVLAKEIERARRFGHPVSLILFDVDRLSTINADHGYSVGDKVLERLGILIRGFFRQHDWVARHSDDAIAVLLTHTDPEHATKLAEAVRGMVEERLTFIDHRTNRPVHVTLSGSIVHLRLTTADLIDTDRLIAASEAAVGRAKRQGRNRVERIDGLTSQIT
jgi:diguanylate cyclase (GGDEF)-like protein